MQAWKITIVGTVVIAAVIVAALHYGFDPFARNGGNAHAAHRVTSDPVTPVETSGERTAPASEHGWGPFRATDW